MTTDETGRQFVYDAWNRLKVVKNSSGTVHKTYGYDGLNRRISETTTSTTDLYYSSQWQVLEERVAGATSASNVWSSVYVDAMILRDRDTDANGTLDERLYPTHDANFNVTGLINASGSVAECYAYDAFGKATVLNAAWTTISASAYGWVYLHQGGRLDSTSGLEYFRNRDYSVTLGRWVTMDPIRYSAGDVNLYRAEMNNPTSTLDFSGLDVNVYWIEGAELGKGGNYLEVNIVDKLKEHFSNAKDVHWNGYKTGLGIGSNQQASRINDTIKRDCGKKDKIVLIGYSWGAYRVSEVLADSVTNPNGTRKNRADYTVDNVFTIDLIPGIFGALNSDDKDGEYSNSVFKIREYKVKGMAGDFKSWNNWLITESCG